ncbi:MAG TPA: MFS transporter [Rhodospirillaceae bacterium]|nr:MFS transporter [Rhodospirillaceae bacterium]HAT35125.1 MFS transporter [Rhodospirillaceae bacterium]
MTSPLRRWLTMASLMLAGEAIFLLPYMRKTFQTSLEEVFHVSSMELGYLSSMFGILALLCYFPGGWLADRISTRRLLSFSLIATGSGGLVMLTIPTYPQMLALHAFWGVTSILTFWAALLKATRMWGTPETQGTSFGLLEGGRGATAALMATLATAAFAAANGNTDPRAGLVAVIWVYSAAPLLAGIVVWFLLSDETPEREVKNGVGKDLLRRAFSTPEVWFMAGIIFIAYLIFTGSYYFPAYAERGLGESKVFGAQLGTFRDWLRPFAAIVAGLIADRIGVSRGIAIGFAVLAVLYGSLWAVPSSASSYQLLFAQVAVIAIMLFALRGIYFALMEECRIPLALTGITIGLVSALAYTPDIFSHLIAGWFLDTYSGGDGFRYFFGFLAVTAIAGLAVTIALRHRLHSSSH